MKKEIISSVFSSIKPSSERYLLGARLFVAFASVAGFIWVLLYFFAFNAPMVALIILIGSLVGVFIFVLSFTLKKGDVIANLSIFDFVATLGLVEYYTGGINSPNNYWLLIIPVMAFFFAGFSRGLFWSLIVGWLLLFFEYLEAIGFSPPLPIPSDKVHIWTIVKVFSAYFIMITITAIYEFSRISFEKNLANKADDLLASETKLKKTLVYLNVLNDDLRKLNEIKSEFTAMVSHELRTPLTAITQGIKILLDGKAGELSEEQRSFLELTNRNVKRLSRLVNDVLDFQKLDTKRMEFYWEENDINEVVSEVVQNMSGVAKEKGLKLEVDPGEDVEKIVFDRDKIIQVVTNLLSNAIKYTSEGKITLSTKMEKEGVRVAVADTGIGIPEEDISRIFTSFTQLESGRNKRPGGSGLGLAISKKIIEAHKGRIWVDSSVDKGSVFSFLVPFTRRSSIVLIVPEEIVLNTCRYFLKRKGYFVFTADRGIMGLDEITKQKPDIIILDSGIDDISFEDFLEKVRSLSEFSSIPILILTDDDSKVANIPGRENEAEILWIKKPFELNRLYNMLQGMVK